MFIEEIAKYLDGLDLVDFREDTKGGDTFIDHVPALPDAVIGIFTNPGLAGDFKFAYDNPSFQVRARAGKDPRVASARLKAIYDALHGLGMTAMGDYLVIKIEATQSEPAPIGADDNGRYEYTVNFDAHVKVAATANRI
jgi:hypothetical protein